MSPPREVLNTAGLHCKVAGQAFDGQGKAVRDRLGRPVFGCELNVSLDGVQLHDCIAVVIGADGVTGVVRRRTCDSQGRYITRNDPISRIATHTERGQIEVWTL